MSVVDDMNNLLSAMSLSRSGRTTAIINGVKNSDAILVVFHESQAREISRNFPGVKVIAFHDLRTRLAGRLEPVVIDHYVYECVISKAIRDVKELQDNLQKERDNNRVLRNKIEELEDKLMLARITLQEYENGVEDGK